MKHILKTTLNRWFFAILEIIEVGHHEQLMNNDGEYKKLFNLQSKWYKEKVLT